MKLIELLARELKEWPSDNDTYAWQDYESMEIRFNYTIAGDFVATGRADDCQRRRSEPHPTDPSGYVTREQWEAAHQAITPTIEMMLTEWRDLEARAHAAQAEADALFEHAGQCHGEIVVRLAELGWGAPRGKPVVTLDTPLDMTDWCNWEVGDIVRIIANHAGHQFEQGDHTTIIKINPHDEKYRVEANHPERKDWWLAANDAVWISRPSTQP